MSSITYRVAYMLEQAFMAYDQPFDRIQQKTLQADRSKGIFFLDDSNVGNRVLEQMSGVLQISIKTGTGLAGKVGVDTANTESTRYIEVSNGYSVASTKTVAGYASVAWEEGLQLLAPFGAADASAAGFTVRLFHDLPLLPEWKWLGFAMPRVSNWFRRGIDDVLGAAIVSLDDGEIAALIKGERLLKDVELRVEAGSDGVSAGTISIELTYRAFSEDQDAPSRGAWQVAAPATEKLVGKRAASKHAWAEMMPVARSLELSPEPVVLERVAFVDHVASDTQVWISRSLKAKQVVVAFRGTTNLNDWNLDFNRALTEVKLSDWHSVRIHSGFLASWRAVETEVSTLISACIPKGEDPAAWRVTAVGHSLGGALASVAAFHLAASNVMYEVSMVTVASPRAGNQAFARAWLEDPSRQVRIVDSARVVNQNDVVTKVPVVCLRRSAQPQQANEDDRYNHTMCKALILRREWGGGVTVETLNQGVERWLDNVWSFASKIFRFLLLPYSEHIYNYPLLLRDAFFIEQARRKRAAVAASNDQQ